jgi:hypothetical protein
MADIPHNFVKSRMVSDWIFVWKITLKNIQADGTNIPNFTSEHLEERKLSAEEEDTVKWAAASLYSGGADTVSSFV